MAKEEKIDRPAMTFKEFVKRPPKLTVLTDHPLMPTEAFDADTFNFRYKLGPLYDILRSTDTKTPMAILISGDWGMGKTSAMKWLHGLLEKWNSKRPQDVLEKDYIKVRPIWFYPWKYDNKEDVWRGLLAEVILNAMNSDADVKTIIEAFKTASLFVGKSVLALASATKIKLSKLEISGEALTKIKDELKDAVYPEKAYLNPYEKALEDWLKKTLSGNNRMVIFIDDLDRCMPNIALQVLEALKLYLNIPNLIFILGVHKKVIDKLVKEHYKKLGLTEDESKDYLAKMFQVEVELEPTEQQISDFFEKQLTDIPYWTDGLLDSEQELFRDLVLKSVGRNPREVKRLLNSALMKGAGSVLMKKDGIKFNQGLQLFFVRKILDERYTMASEAGSKRGIDFFVEWSEIVRRGREKDEDFPLTIKVPSDFGRAPQKELDIEEKTRKRLDNLFAPFAPEEYHDFLKNPKFSALLHLLVDEDLGKLMQIPYPAEAAEVAEVIGTSKDADIVRETVARQLKKKPDELTDDDYPKIIQLDLSRSGISELSPLKEFTNLQTLYLSGAQVADVGSLASLTSLQELGLSGTQVSDVDPLASLMNLQVLNLWGTQVTDVSPLASLTNLRELSLMGTKVTDVGPLASLTNLQTLWLNNTQVIDIGVLAGLTNLRELNLTGTQVTDVGPLASLTNLQTLWLRVTQVADVGPLASPPNLQLLDLSFTQVTDVGSLASLTTLQTLGLRGTHVTEIEPLVSLTNLQRLDLRDTQVTDIGALSGITNLQTLSLSRTQVTDIGALSGLTNLQRLDLSSTKVIDIGALAGLTNLQTLDLSDTQVIDIGALAGLTNLQELHLSDTQVVDIGVLAGLTNLQAIYLSGTTVSDIGALSGLTNLEGLELGDTQVSDDQVAKLKKALPKLDIIQ